MERYAKSAAALLAPALGIEIQATELETPPQRELGDFAFACFKLAKERRKAPPQIAKEITDEVKKLQTESKDPHAKHLTVAAVGPYVNFTVDPKQAAADLLKDILSGTQNGQYGKLPSNSRSTWVIEYSSPNVAKPFQIYHVRPTALGAALARIGQYRGHKMITINHLGDWGTQYGKLAVAFRLFGKDLPQKPSMLELVDIYVRVHDAAKKDPSLEDEAREAFKKLEQGDPAMQALWKKCVDISLEAFGKLYDRLDIKFDHIWGESFYTPHIPALLDELKQKKLLEESEGAQVVFVKDENNQEIPPCIIQKSDGATIYATRDLAAALYRYKKFKFDRMTYVVGGEQKLHFKQVFAVLKKMGHEWVSKCEHVPTGLYRFGDAKMSTRKGNFVTLDELLSMAKEKVIALMNEREKEYTPAEFETTAEAVATGAVVFNDLSTDPARDVDFTVDRVVDFNGETGPYLQYAHTRCLSILRKARESGELKAEAPSFDLAASALLKEPLEIFLIKRLGQLPVHLERVLQTSKASHLTNYLIDLTKDFGTFYREHHVLGQTPELTHARLMLVESTRRVLAQGLTLLGLKLPERM